MSNVTAISLTAPKAAKDNPVVTPELLASVLAKYSRSNKGIKSLLASIDPTDPDAAVDRILKFVDYGHASIGGLTGGIAVAIDDVSMYLAYRLFEFSAMADGQESSTRYISLTSESLPDPVSLGFTADQAPKVTALWTKGLDLYHRSYKLLDEAATKNPEVVRYPANAKPIVIDRIRKNYALDRARYFLPFATTTNVALVQSARMWTETISALTVLGNLGQTEAKTLAEQLKTELSKYCPRLVRHARSKPGWVKAMQEELELSVTSSKNVYSELQPPAVQVLNAGTVERLDKQLADSISIRENRYDRCGVVARQTPISIFWPQLPIAELRDLNRHRTGGRFSPLSHEGFYLPREVTSLGLDADINAFLEELNEFAATVPASLAGYIRFLGSITSYSHSTMFDKYVYTTELRTGAGAHFLYAEKYRETVEALQAQGYSATVANIHLGDAEPE